VSLDGAFIHDKEVGSDGMKTVASDMRLTPTPDASGLASMTQAVEFILCGTIALATIRVEG
jgi:hypothetical protein